MLQMSTVCIWKVKVYMNTKTTDGFTATVCQELNGKLF